jgi:Kef-type K+ transport system membrane component KefB
MSGSLFITLLFCVLAVVAYRRFRLPSLVWLMMVGFWNLLQEPARVLLNQYVVYLKYHDPSRMYAVIDAFSGGSWKRLSLLAIGVAQPIGVILLLAFLLVLMRDLCRLLNKQPQASASESESEV